ncbi:hypothetical protein HK096_006886 [Nowakowskiella sp. JEL0078]|nr:hypothetical protein HK096_006886 [Nowakowskiella sp. JEL0078]
MGALLSKPSLANHIEAVVRFKMLTLLVRLEFSQISPTEAGAMKVMQKNGWNIERAMDAYFNNQSKYELNVDSQVSAIDKTRIEALYLRYKDEDEDLIGIDGVLQFCEDLEVDPQDVVVLVIAWYMSAQKIGEFTKAGFINGVDSIEKLKEELPRIRSDLNDKKKFKEIYEFTFKFGLQENRKNLSIESASSFWKLLLDGKFRYLDLWLKFLEDEDAGKAVTKDTWNLMPIFVEDCDSDPDFESHDENSAWPVLIDSFSVHRSLVTDLQAANNYKITHAQSEAVLPYIRSAKTFYIEGYHLTVSPETIMFIAKYASENNKVFSLNLSAPFISQFFTKPLDEVLAYTDILFGNEAEAVAFAEAHDFGTTDVKEIALKVAAIPLATAGRSRTVVFTQGSQPTIIVQNKVITEYAVIPIAVESIVDTNGAGDAFAGGFLAAIVLGKSIKEAVAAGNYVANVVIQRVGPTYPREAPSFTFA